MSAEQPSLFGPDFDGVTYQRTRDHLRLTGQLARVRAVLADGRWHTIPGIHQIHPQDSPQAISARIRDLRKEKFGGCVIEHQYVSRGLWRYRMIKAEQ